VPLTEGVASDASTRRRYLTGASERETPLNESSVIDKAKRGRRQLARPFARTAGREDVVIREHFPIDVGLRAQKIETIRPATTVVNDLLMAIRGE
jgi:hypothetical protein